MCHARLIPPRRRYPSCLRHRAVPLLASRASHPRDGRHRDAPLAPHAVTSWFSGDGSESSGVATDWLSIRGHWPVGSFQHTAGPEPGCTTASGPAVPTQRSLATGSQPVAAQALRSWAAPPTRCGLAGDPAPWPDTGEPAPRRSGRGAPARPRVIRGARRCDGSGAGNFAIMNAHPQDPHPGSWRRTASAFGGIA
jgi:hypothetical protein